MKEITVTFTFDGGCLPMIGGLSVVDKLTITVKGFVEFDETYVPEHGDFGMSDQTLSHDFTGPQLVTSDKDVDVGGIFGQICARQGGSASAFQPLTCWRQSQNSQVASSAALSPPPMTARGLFLNMGTAPSQTAQAEIPDCQ